MLFRSFTLDSTEQSNQGSVYMNPDDAVIDAEVIEFWNSVKHSLPLITEFADEPIRVDANCKLPANTDAYVHLVTETKIIPRVFVSEKTWKPIAAGQLFLIFGNPGTVNYLRTQGVDVFDDIIDHSYDLEPDWKIRLELIHQQLDRLITQNLKQLFINTHSRRQANRDKFFSGAFDQTYLHTIQQCINMLN